MTHNPSSTNRSTYDQIARRFAEINAAMPSTLVEAGKRFLEQLPPGAGFLDLGCGAGRDLAWFEGVGLRGTGADLSAGMLAEARRVTRCPLVQADFLRLPFAAGAFGGVWCNAALLHLPRTQLPHALAEIRRVIFPGGILFLGMKQGEGEGFQTLELPGLPAFDRYFTYYQPEGLAASLEAAGLPVREQEINTLPNATWIQFHCRRL